MIRIALEVRNRLGIHARPSGLIVEVASKSSSQVRMIYDGMTANARSILNVMMLAVEPGARVDFEIEGVDEEQVAETLRQLFEARFNEEN
jgi:phosphocarrier protein HPr